MLQHSKQKIRKCSNYLLFITNDPKNQWFKRTIVYIMSHEFMGQEFGRALLGDSSAPLNIDRGDT